MSSICKVCNGHKAKCAPDEDIGACIYCGHSDGCCFSPTCDCRYGLVCPAQKCKACNGTGKATEFKITFGDIMRQKLAQ